MLKDVGEKYIESLKQMKTRPKFDNVRILDHEQVYIIDEDLKLVPLPKWKNKRKKEEEDKELKDSSKDPNEAS